jgi:hypothetical protein
MRGSRTFAAGSLALMVGTLVVGAPRPALGSARECRSQTKGFQVAGQHVKWTTVQAFQAVNGSNKPSSVTWTVSRSESRSYEVSGNVGIDGLFDFLSINVNGAIQRSWSSTIGESLEASVPARSKARAVYQVGVQHVSGSQWYCDLKGQRHWQRYTASAPFGHRFVRTQ